MKNRIILTVDDGLSSKEIEDLRYLLSDALGDFAVKRADPISYVETRYPGPDYYPDREEKVQQVARRVKLARKLHNAALGFTVIEEEHLNHLTCPDPYAVACARWAGLTAEEALLAFQLGLHEGMHGQLDRAKALITCLQQTLGMTEEEAVATYNQLEDKRVAKLMAEKDGLS